MGVFVLLEVTIKRILSNQTQSSEKKENKMPKKGSKKKVEGKYDKYLLTDVIKDSSKKEWGGQVISPGPGHEDLLPSDIWARAAISVVR